MQNYKELFEQTNNVYYRLQDEESRKIYRDRVMNSITYDYSYITDMTVDGFQALEYLKSELAKYLEAGQKLILDGAGYYGKSIYMSMPELPWECFSDGSPKEKEWMDLPVYTRKDTVKKYPEGVYVITSMVFGDQIKKELESYHIEHIIDFGKYLCKHVGTRANQYYDVLPFDDKEIIADVGCFDCATIFEYFKYGNDKFKKIYSFEPEPLQYVNCKKIIAESKRDNWEIHNLGVWDEPGKLRFSCNESCSIIDENGDTEVDVVTLDQFFKDHETPTFIKMDIEGAEMHALKGAAELIKNERPKLAICVYHKPEDIFEIPQYILSLNPSYKMYLRHYTNLVNETVLYCI